MNFPRLLLRVLLGRRLPYTRGRLNVAGLHSRVRIHRDRWGIPHIEADNDHDAYFGLGFCQGQDRAFQLEILQRVVRGTLAEMIGPAALPIDRLARRIGFHHAACRQEKMIDADVWALLDAFTQGITAGSSQGLPRRPHEFALLRCLPTPWTGADCLGLIKLMSFTLASNWDAELARLRILQRDGVQALLDLDPAYREGHPVTSPPGDRAGPAIDLLAQDVAAMTSLVGVGGGSNNWALDCSRTATGRPLLANDPHLNANLPAHWYLAHVQTPAWAAAGAAFAGGPSIIVGHNGHAAWGVTAGLVDNTDLFREQIGPDGQSVRQGNGWVACAVREETIAVKGSEPVRERVLLTPRGPIVSPALDPQWEALALRAVWLDPLPLRGLLTAQRARHFADFRRELSQWPAMAQNVVYADAGGAIGWQLAGQAPRRRKGHGLIPLPGWDPEAGWESEDVPFDAMPHLSNPDNGFVATANTQPRVETGSPFLGGDWIDGYRLEAINRALAGRRDWDVARTLALQADQQTVAWEEIRPSLEDVPAGNSDTRLALHLLHGWDGRVTVNSAAATIYELFLSEMVGRAVRARAPHSAEAALGAPLSSLTRLNYFCFRRTGYLAGLLRRRPEGWFSRSWSEEIADALAAVVQRLRRQHGSNPERWAWGRMRVLVMHHPLGGQSRLLGRIFNLAPVPCGGDTDTIAQAMVKPLTPLAPADNLASLRAVIDVGAWGNSRFVLPGGQSGNPLSPHYGDLFPLWRRGEGVPIAWTAEEVRQATRHTLELAPET